MADNSVKQYLSRIGKKGGLKGGKARAKKLGKARTKKSAIAAANARWEKYYKDHPEKAAGAEERRRKRSKKKA